MSSIELVIKSDTNLFQPFLIHIYDTFTIKDIKKCLYCIFPYTKSPENISIISAVELNEDQIISKIVADSVTEPFIFYNGAPCLLVKFDESEDVEEIKNYHVIHQEKTGSDLVNTYLKNLESNQLTYSSAFQQTYGMSSDSMQFSTRTLNNTPQSASTLDFKNDVKNRHNQQPGGHTHDNVTHRHTSEPRPQHQQPAPQQPPAQPADDPVQQNDLLGVVVNEAFGVRININAFGMNLALDPVNILWTIMRLVVIYFLLFSQTSIIRLLLMVITYLTAIIMWKVFRTAFQEQVTFIRNWLRHHPPNHQMSADVNGGEVGQASTGMPANNAPSNQQFAAIHVPRMGLISCLIDNIKQIFKAVSIFIAGFLISLFPHHRNL